MTREERMAAIGQLRDGIAKYKRAIKSLEDEIRELQDIGESEIENRITAVCEATGISRKDIFGKSRMSEIVEARHFLCYILHEKYSLSETGRIVGLDHSAVHHAVKRMNGLISIKDKRILSLFEKVKPRLN